MTNFELYNPTNYIFGKDQIQKLTDLVPKNTKILLAYGGGSIFKNGVHAQVIKALSGFEIIEFGGIEPNQLAEAIDGGLGGNWFLHGVHRSDLASVCV